MGNKETAVAKMRKLLEKKADMQMHRYALTGDGSDATTCDVEGRAGWAWVRYDEKQDKPSQVINWLVPGLPQGVPIIVGKRYPMDKYYQILGINLELYYQGMGWPDYIQYVLPKHGDSHTARSGGDPAWIDVRNLLPGRARPAEMPSLSVYVEALHYEYSGNLIYWGGGFASLASHIPTTTNYHRYVVVCLIPSSNSLTVIRGAAGPVTIAATLPPVPTGYITIAAVLMRNGMTTIVENDIYDYRILFPSVGGYIKTINDLLATVEAEFDYALTEHIVGG